MRMGIASVACAMTCLWLGGTGCEHRPVSTVIARVGKATLTLNDLQQGIPPEYRGKISREQQINYAKQWIDQELLYQAAISRGIQREPQVNKRIERVKRDILCAEMLARGAGTAADGMQISIEDIRLYYEQNRERFVRPRDVARFQEILVDDLKTAWKVREMVTRDNFFVLAERYSKQPVQNEHEVPWIPIDSLPPPRSEVIRQIKIGGTSQPVKVEDGFVLIRVIDKQPAGTLCSLAEAQPEIINMLSVQRQKSEIGRVLSELRQKIPVSFNFEVIPRDDSVPTADTAAAGR